MAFLEKVALKWLYRDFAKFLAVFSLFLSKVDILRNNLASLEYKSKIKDFFLQMALLIEKVNLIFLKTFF